MEGWVSSLQLMNIRNILFFLLFSQFREEPEGDIGLDEDIEEE